MGFQFKIAMVTATLLMGVPPALAQDALADLQDPSAGLTKGLADLNPFQTLPPPPDAVLAAPKLVLDNVDAISSTVTAQLQSLDKAVIPQIDVPPIQFPQ